MKSQQARHRDQDSDELAEVNRRPGSALCVGREGEHMVVGGSAFGMKEANDDNQQQSYKQKRAGKSKRRAISHDGSLLHVQNGSSVGSGTIDTPLES